MAVVIVVFSLVLGLWAGLANGAIVLEQWASAVQQGNTVIAATFPASPTEGNLLVAIAGNRTASDPPATPSGWTLVREETGNEPGQLIYYKIAGPAESTALTIGPYSAVLNLGMHLYEYSGVDSSNPLASSMKIDGLGTAVTSGIVDISEDGSLILSGFTAAGKTAFDGWNNGFLEEWDFTNGGQPASAGTYSGADLVAGSAGSYSTSATMDASLLWISQTAVFNPTPPPVLEYVVTHTGDSGAGSLRDAIDYANLNTGTTITFDIPNTDLGYMTDGTDHWWRIIPATGLPLVSANGTTIDGSSQTTNQGDVNTRGPEIEIHGVSAGVVDGLTVSAAGDVVLRSLVINDFEGNGVQINGMGAVGGGVYGCYIGTDAVGENAVGNTIYGIWVTNGANDIDIGSGIAGDGNLISGNVGGVVVDTGTSVRVRGNLVGVDRTGTAIIANSQGILVSGTSTSVTIGGSSAGEGNQVAGNGSQISIEGSASSVTMFGNIIGTDPSGTIDLSNGRGIELDSSADPSGIGIGGLMPGEGNLLAYNTTGIMVWWNGGGHRIRGNTIRDGSGGGVTNYAPNVEMAGNLILNNSSLGVYIAAGSAQGLLYHNTIHGNGSAGVEIATDGSAALHNNVITGNATYGLFLSGGTLDSESYNLVTDDVTNPPNGARCNYALDPTDLNADPLFVNAAGGNYALTECTSPAINSGTDLSGSQPDLNGWDPGNFNGPLPDLGALESACLASGMAVSGRVFEDADFSGTPAGWDGGVGDHGMANVDVELYDGTDTFVSSATTDATGAYSFVGIADGSFKVRVRSATLGDADTPPVGGLNAGIPVTWNYPLPELSWANGAALIGGQDATVDDTATGDDAGPGDTWSVVTVSGSSVTGVDFGFAFNLIVNTADDGLANATRSSQGSLRQFLKNANAIGTDAPTTANSSQFHMQVAAGQSDGADSWWRITPVAVLPALADPGTDLDGATQTSNGGDSNSRGPEVEINGATVLDVNGLTLTSADHRINSLVINGFDDLPGTGIVLDGGLVTGTVITGCYVGTNAVGDAEIPNRLGIALANGATGTVIGGSGAGEGNVISGSNSYGIDFDNAGANTTIQGNRIGTNAAGDAAMPNTSGIYIDGGTAIVIGGSGVGEGNLISGNILHGINLQFGDDVTIQGNWMGLNLAGTDPLPDGGTAVYGWSVDNVKVGGSGPGEGNIIAGNDGFGISLGPSCQKWVIQGNTIGVGPLGTETNLGNTGAGNIRISPNDITIDAIIGGVNPGEGNLIAYASGPGIGCVSIGAAVEIIGNVIRNNAEEGITARVDSLTVAMNLIYDNGPGFDGILIEDVASDGKVYQNTIHGNGDDGIEIVGLNHDVRNNIITGNAGFGINVSAGTMTESNNLVTDGVTSPGNALGRSNVALNAGDLNADPLYFDVAAGDFSLTECTSPGINVGLDLGVDQPDINGTDGGLFTGPAPDMGALETACVPGGAGISGRVFEDADFLGMASGWDGGVGDVGLANVDVELYDGNDSYLTSTLTSGDGSFSFMGLADGTYRVRARSATIGDDDTLPTAGLNGTVPGTWPYPVPEMTWGHGTALLGGQDATVGDTATDDNAGSGDTWVALAISGADVTGADFGFVYNLIVNVADDGAADSVASDQGSLRQFLKNANAIVGTTSSYFNIPAPLVAGAHTIQPLSALPDIADPVVIDGTTEPDFSTTPVIEIDGSNAVPADGLNITGGGTTVRGLAINRFSGSGEGAGIYISSGGNNVIEGNFIGTNVTGTATRNNSGVGIYILSSSNQIGGTTVEQRNIISGNNNGIRINGGFGTVVQGNFIGTDVTGTLALGNVSNGIWINGTSGHTVGGTVPGAGNVIAASDLQGILLFSTSNNLIEGNFIGTDLAGSLDLHNSQNNITVASNSSNNTIGGTLAGAANTLAWSPGAGVSVSSGNKNPILGNSFHDNVGLGIDLDVTGVNGNDAGDEDPGANDIQNFPVLSHAATDGDTTIAIKGVLNSSANTAYRVEFFSNTVAHASGYGEGENYLGFTDVTTDGMGDADIKVLLPAAVAIGEFVTATATGSLGNTSEFSAGLAAELMVLHSISGLVFEDSDFAGTATNWDGGTGDAGIPNVDVELYDEADAYMASATTDIGGSFSFVGLLDGAYKVRVRSATLGDADSPPSGGFNADVPAVWPYPLPEMIWGHGAAIIGGQDANVDDTATGAEGGPGDTWVSVTISGGDLGGVNLGFSYDLIVNVEDDANPDSVRSKQGTLRQFIKNSNAIGGVNMSWFRISSP